MFKISQVCGREKEHCAKAARRSCGTACGSRGQPSQQLHRVMLAFLPREPDHGRSAQAGRDRGWHKIPSFKRTARRISRRCHCISNFQVTGLIAEESSCTMNLLIALSRQPRRIFLSSDKRAQRSLPSWTNLAILIEKPWTTWVKLCSWCVRGQTKQMMPPCQATW